MAPTSTYTPTTRLLRKREAARIRQRRCRQRKREASTLHPTPKKTSTSNSSNDSITGGAGIVVDHHHNDIPSMYNSSSLSSSSLSPTSLNGGGEKKHPRSVSLSSNATLSPPQPEYKFFPTMKQHPTTDHYNMMVGGPGSGVGGAGTDMMMDRQMQHQQHRQPTAFTFSSRHTAPAGASSLSSTIPSMTGSYHPHHQSAHPSTIGGQQQQQSRTSMYYGNHLPPRPISAGSVASSSSAWDPYNAPASSHHRGTGGSVQGPPGSQYGISTNPHHSQHMMSNPPIHPHPHHQMHHQQLPPPQAPYMSSPPTVRHPSHSHTASAVPVGGYHQPHLHQYSQYNVQQSQHMQPMPMAQMHSSHNVYGNQYPTGHVQHLVPTHPQSQVPMSMQSYPGHHYDSTIHQQSHQVPVTMEPSRAISRSPSASSLETPAPMGGRRSIGGEIAPAASSIASGGDASPSLDSISHNTIQQNHNRKKNNDNNVMRSTIQEDYEYNFPEAKETKVFHTFITETAVKRKAADKNKSLLSTEKAAVVAMLTLKNNSSSDDSSVDEIASCGGATATTSTETISSGTLNYSGSHDSHQYHNDNNNNNNYDNSTIEDGISSLSSSMERQHRNHHHQSRQQELAEHDDELSSSTIPLVFNLPTVSTPMAV